MTYAASAAAGFIIDATAIARARSSIFLQTLIRTNLAQDRRIVIPATALLQAASTGRITPEELNHRGITIVALTEPSRRHRRNHEQRRHARAAAHCPCRLRIP